MAATTRTQTQCTRCLKECGSFLKQTPLWRWGAVCTRCLFSLKRLARERPELVRRRLPW